MYKRQSFDNAIGYYCNEGLKSRFTELGCEYMGVECGMDTAVQIQQIENFITMGTACMYVASGDPNAIKDVLLSAAAAGTRCMFYGANPDYEISGTVNVDLTRMGYELSLLHI